MLLLLIRLIQAAASFAEIERKKHQRSTSKPETALLVATSLAETIEISVLF